MPLRRPEKVTANTEGRAGATGATDPPAWTGELLGSADGDGAGDGLIAAGDVADGDATLATLEHAAVTSDRATTPKTSTRRTCIINTV
jgi:hypothetical protein